MRFRIGRRFGKAAGCHPIRLAPAMAAVGCVLVASTMALGGEPVTRRSQRSNRVRSDREVISSDTSRAMRIAG